MKNHPIAGRSTQCKLGLALCYKQGVVHLPSFNVWTQNQLTIRDILNFWIVDTSKFRGTEKNQIRNMMNKDSKVFVMMVVMVP